ncbi:MAG: SDR family oxidoreductase [Planctomycetota bacterium]|jgi:uncharacterized protein YbjT (DUF2867 family)
MNDKIFVTGATGNVGGEVLQKLLIDGEPVRAGFRSFEDGAALKAWGVDTVRFDYTDPGTYAGALDGVDRVFLVSPPADPEAPAKVFPFVDFAVRAGVRLIVNVSAMGADYDDASPLYRIESRIRASGVDAVILRPTWFMQNLTGFLLEAIVNQGGIFVPAAEGRTSFIDVRDIAGVAVKALTEPGHAGKIYTLTGDRALDYYEVASILSAVSNCELLYVPLTEDEARQGWANHDWPAASVEYLLALFSYVREGYTASVSPDVKALLGRDPIPFETFAHDYKEVFRRREAPAEC